MSNTIENRLAKAIEVKKALLELEITEEICPNLTEFSKILNEWVKTDEWFSGKIKLPEPGRKLVYQLRDPNNTFVKLSEMV